MNEAMIFVGALAGAFGVKGEVRLKSFTTNPEAIADYNPLFTKDGIRSFNVRLTGRIKNAYSARLSGIITKEQADALSGMQLFVPRSKLPTLQDDEFYYADLVGLDVFNAGGKFLGQIKSVQNYGATDLLEIKKVCSSEKVLLSFTSVNVPNVDISSGKIVVDPPDALFE